MDARKKLSDYYYKFEEPPYYTWAAFLDPQISYDTLVMDYQNEPDLLADIQMAKKSFEEHFQITYTTTSAPMNSALGPAPAASDSSVDASPQKIDFLSCYCKRDTG
ncbi:hypothetical protein GYMLUDRAFT_60980 [Collybiopsis luxurians FD-317 M1]|uniref:Uncharacterized protein n=1 Tax=Collybiopsis luxurians FD-317 M1 TaxID=944289 RepID=A0A0D0CHW2_9AGAR|nr:hypothetical protein GYMLUDRAFT_60980 [Collybiopsis luxurians FD-317 M1]